MVVVVYTDGSCLGNPGPGGWAYGDSPENITSGGCCDTTNNRMELTAAIRALKDLPPGDLTVVTDSAYVRNGVTKWCPSWVQKGWVTASGKPVKNRDLWEELTSLTETRTVTWQWCRAHNGIAMNEAVDRAARREAHAVSSSVMRT
jgi:ribonuclease HI